MASDGSVIIDAKLDDSALDRGLSGLTGKLDSVGARMQSIGKGMTVGVTAPIVAGFALATQAAISYESAFAGVRKTVDASEAEYSALSDALLDMSTRLPATANEIAAVAESAGQLGIEKGNIEGFTQTVIDLGEATNLTADQAATEFARFANIMGMPQDEFDRLGSSVVELGNNMATTESEIVAMSMRLAGTANQVGLSEAEVAALAATMSSLGIESEAGGTAMSMVMKKINTAVSEGGQGLSDFAAVSGLSADEFAQLWQNEPMAALQTFISGLEETGASGEDLTGVLDNLGITGIRESDTLLRLAGDSSLLADAVGLSTEAWDANSALADEAAQRYATTESKIAMLKNTITAIGIAIGNVLKPAFNSVLDVLMNVATAFLNTSDNVKIIVVAFAAVAAAIGPVLLVLGTVLKMFASLKAGTGILAIGLGALKTAFAFLTGPIGLTVAAIMGLVAVFTYLWNTNEQFRTKVTQVWTQVQSFISTAITTIRAVVMSIWGAVVAWWNANQQSIYTTAMAVWNSLYGAISAALTSVGAFIRSLWGSVVAWWNANQQTILTAARNVWTAIQAVITVVMPIIAMIIRTAWTAIQFIIQAVWQNIKGVIQGGLTFIQGLITLFAGIFSGNFTAMWNGIKMIFQGAVQFLWNAVQLLLWGRLIKGVVSFIGLFRSQISNLWNMARNIFMNGINAVRNFFTNGFRVMQDIATGFQTFFMNVIRAAWTFVRNVFTTSLNIIRSRFVTGFNQIRAIAQTVMSAIRQLITTIWNAIKSFFSSVISSIRANFNTQLNRMRSIASSVMNAIRNVIQVSLRAAGAIVEAVMSTIRSVFVASVNTVRSVVSAGFNFIRGIISSVLNAIRWNVSAAWNTIRSTISSVTSSIKNTVSRIFNSLKSIVSSAFSRVKTAVSNGMQRAYDTVTGFLSKFSEAGRNIVSNIASGIRNAVSLVTDAIGNVTSKIRDYLPFSPAKEGALRDIMKVNVAGSIAETINKGAKAPIKAMHRLTGDLQKEVEHASQASSKAFDPSLIMPNVQTPDVVNGLTGEYAKKMQQITAGAQVLAGGHNINANHNYEAQVNVNVYGNVDQEGITWLVNQTNGKNDSVRRGFD